MKKLVWIWAVGGVVASTSQVVATDWPQWRGPNRDSISTETGWRTDWSNEPKKLWETSVGVGLSSVVVSQGRLFTLGNSNDRDTISCLDSVTGKLNWSHSYACKLDPNSYEGGPSSTPTVDHDRVYTLSKEGHLFCLDVADGKVVWSRHIVKDWGAEPPQWGFAASPLVLGDTLIITAGGNGTACLALKKTDGSVIWKAGDDKAGYATSHPFQWNDKKLLAEFNAAGLVIRNQADGAESARYRWKTSYDVNAITPIVMDSKVFISSGYSKGGVLLDIKSGEAEEVWKLKRIRSDYSTPVLWKGHLYGFDVGDLTCIGFDTGDVKWSQPGFGKGALKMADGKLIVQTQDTGELVLVEASPDAYKELGRMKVFEGKSSVMPVLANGLLYAKSNLGQIACFDLRGK